MSRLALGVLLVLAGGACTESAPSPRHYTVEKPARAEPEHSAAPKRHAAHEHPHGAHPHPASDHHHHPHPHPHLAGENNHHHPY